MIAKLVFFMSFPLCGAALLLFVGLVVGLGAIFDGLKLAEALFGLIQESVRGDTEWGRWFEESLLEVRLADQLARLCPGASALS